MFSMNRLYKSSKNDESPNIGRYGRYTSGGKERLFNYKPSPNWRNDYERPMNCEDFNYFYWYSHDMYL